MTLAIDSEHWSLSLISLAFTGWRVHSRSLKLIPLRQYKSWRCSIMGVQRMWTRRLSSESFGNGDANES